MTTSAISRQSTPLPTVSATEPRPFLRWAGGKRQLLPELMPHVPEGFGRYFEPFVGAGALFFALAAQGRFDSRRPSNEPVAFLNDINAHLMHAYLGLQHNHDRVVELLRAHEEAHRELPAGDYYLQMRAGMPDVTTTPTARTAAWFIYMNKTCFNGIWRVNAAGRFNVPMDKQKSRPIVDAAVLRAAAVALRSAFLTGVDFEKATEDARPGDFVYFDPPYIPVSATSDFTSYTTEGFGSVDQQRLCSWARELKARGVRVLLSNSDTPATRELYGKGFQLQRVFRGGRINAKVERRQPVAELLIS